MNTCEQAVQLGPEHGEYLHSRGLARALTGDLEGSIEDFRFYLEWAVETGLSEELISQREAWIAELEAGINPFDEALLEELRDE